MNDTIYSNGCEKIVENMTTDKLVDESHLLLDPNIQVPAIDRFTLYVVVKPTLSYLEREQLSDCLRRKGIGSSYNFRQKKRQKALDIQWVFSLLENNFFQLRIYFDGNGHSILEGMGFVLGLDMEGYKNVFADHKEYQNRVILKQQTKFILDNLSSVLSILRDVCKETSLQFIEVGIKLITLEYCFQQSIPNAYISLHMNNLLANARALYIKVGIATAAKRRTNKTFFADISSTFKIKCYQKLLDAFRIEYILHSFQRKELSLNLDVTWSLFVGDIFKTANKAQLQFKDLLAFDRNYAELPREAALKAFQQSCSKKAFIHIYERLKAGDGQMRIKSSEGFIYRNLSKLIDDGIICKGYSQSEYILMIKFRMLIHDDSTLNEYIKAHHSQYSTEQNSIN